MILLLLFAFPTIAIAGATFGKTQFSHLTPEEFSKSHGLIKPQNYWRNYIDDIYSPYELANFTNTSIDWRKKGVVLPVKNQLMCGSCWAFSAAATIESALAIETGGLESMSEQQLLECVAVDYGCAGGWPDDAFKWVMQNGITTESLYNYSGFPGKCETFQERGYLTKITSYQNLPTSEEQMLGYLHSVGPISIVLDATTFQDYIDGIIDNCIYNRIDHAVVIVGYEPAGMYGNITEYPAYWIIRNSWGAKWGEDGYVRVQYGNNQCGLTYKPAGVSI